MLLLQKLVHALSCPSVLQCLCFFTSFTCGDGSPAGPSAQRQSGSWYAFAKRRRHHGWTWQRSKNLSVRGSFSSDAPLTHDKLSWRTVPDAWGCHFVGACFLVNRILCCWCGSSTFNCSPTSSLAGFLGTFCWWFLLSESAFTSQLSDLPVGLAFGPPCWAAVAKRLSALLAERPSGPLCWCRFVQWAQVLFTFLSMESRNTRLLH